MWIENNTLTYIDTDSLLAVGWGDTVRKLR